MPARGAHRVLHEIFWSITNVKKKLDQIYLFVENAEDQ